ncbi:MAG: glycosyltransferase [Wenzhouxiangella sp.]
MVKPNPEISESDLALAAGFRPGIFCLADREGNVEPDWLDVLHGIFPGARLFARAASERVTGLRAIKVDSRDPEAILAAIIATIGPEGLEDGLLLIRSGLQIPDCFATRLRSIDESPDAPALTVFPGNYDGQVNPIAGLRLEFSAGGLDSLVANCADKRWTAIGHPPYQCCYIKRSAVSGLPDFARFPSSRALVDDAFILDRDKPANHGGQLLPSGRAALGHIRRALVDLNREGVESLPLAGLDGRPVTLHIGHSWGGGIAQWIDDICRHDADGHHLVLASCGNRDGLEHGQSLRLYASGPGRALLREFILTPPIADTAPDHVQYREIIDWLLVRYGIGRILVSSLIGHGLHCLRTPLPTGQILHDFYPASPVLHVDPMPYLGSGGRFGMQRLLEENAAELRFANHAPGHWRRVREAWFDSVQRFKPQLIAPSEHVAERWRKLFRDKLDAVHVIGHGFSPPWRVERSTRIVPRGRADGKLTLVVVGRQSTGKGLGLLKSSIAGLGPHARIVLVGAGKSAEAFFGVAGVDVILDYDRRRLPELLADIGPHAALFLSTVPETWNYVLSETTSLGLVPIATRLGSFSERIDHGRNGVLFDPTPDALIETVAGLAANPGVLSTMVDSLEGEPSVAEVIKRYDSAIPARLVNARPEARKDSSQPLWSAALSESAEQVLHTEELESRLRESGIELDKRAEWARRQERLANERTAWARSLERELEGTRSVLADHQQRLTELEQTRHRLQLLNESQGRELQALDQHRQALEQHLALVLNSLSWRYTRPIRYVMRVGRAMRRQQIWNPVRWPGLGREFWRDLRVRGVWTTLASFGQQSVDDQIVPTVASETPSEAVNDSIDPAPLEPVALVGTENPVVSIVIPVYNKVELTAACLASIAEVQSRLPFEVIVVNDCSSDESEAYLSDCSGITVLRNEVNSGFIDSCNRGGSAARGEFIVFLNNDTTVTDGWLDALIGPFQRDHAIGIVGARLVYPDGRLQEAGGIIFNDASGWNYGRDQDADQPQYSFVSEADYVSGACLAVRRSDFEALGGFDTRFRPAYYEDTDLCFQIRALGKKVIVQPAATIVHHEGGTSGTDLASGAKKHQVINRERFREKWADELAEYPRPEPDPQRADPVRHIRYRRLARRALVIDAVTPQPDHDSGSVRIVAMMTLLGEMRYQVTFAAQNLLRVDGYTTDLQQAGIEVLYAPQVGALEPWLEEHGQDLDLIIVSRHYVLEPMLATLRRHCARARLVFDTVDVHFLREQREAEIIGSSEIAVTAEQTRQQELSLVRDADVTLVVSPVEQELLTELVPGADIRVVSNIHPVHGCRRDWSDRQGLLFVGGFQHVPNVDAARWLVEAIFPLVRAELPNVDLHLIGSRMPRELLSIDQPGVFIHGFVHELEPFLEGCRVSVAPLRYGAGVKGKVNQAMSHGLPVVATSCAAEGMFLEHDQDVLVADTAEDFAHQIVRLYQDQELWKRLSDGGLINVERYFSRDAARRALEGIDELVRINREAKATS